MTNQLVNPAGYGVTTGEHDAVVIARGGNLSVGYCYPFAAYQSALITDDGDTISTVPGNRGFPYANVAASTSDGDVRCGRFCVPLEDIYDGQEGRVRVRGIVECYVYDSSNTAVTVGKELIPVQANQALNAVTASGGNNPRKFLGYALEANSSTPSTPVLMTIDFDGWSGVGGGGNVA